MSKMVNRNQYKAWALKMVTQTRFTWTNIFYQTCLWQRAKCIMFDVKAVEVLQILQISSQCSISKPLKILENQGKTPGFLMFSLGK